jgi:hypothetical protein
MSIVLDGTANTVTPLNGALGATTPSTVAATTVVASGVATFSAGSASAPAITTSGDTNTGIFFPAADTIAFAEGGAEAMRIDASGNFLIGKTSVESTTKGLYIQMSGGGQTGITAASDSPLSLNRLTNDGTIVEIRQGGTLRGSISVSGSTTSYNTSSDYRLKENVQPMVGALDRVALLKPVTYSWKLDGANGEGFIAHELAEICPHAVFGEKDAVNEDGSIKSQGIDTSFLVATLVAAIQELNAKFEEYKASHP